MPTLIIQTNDDGSVSIAAPAQVPPELMADAEQVASLEEAAQVMQDVLGASQSGGSDQPGSDSGNPQDQGDDQGGQQPGAGGSMGQPQPGAQDGGGDPNEEAMEQGFRNVRGAPR